MKKCFIILNSLLVYFIISGCANYHYKKVQKENTLQSYQKFVNKYPNHTSVGEIKIIIDSMDYNNAKNINTLEAYTTYLRKHPYPNGGHYSNDAYNKQIELFQKVDTVLIMVISSATIKKYVEDAFSYLFRQFDIKTITNNDEKNYDAVLKVNVTSSAKGGNYSGQIGGYHYTGADISGTVSFSNNNTLLLKYSFENSKPLASTIWSSYYSPSDAPVKETLNKSNFPETLAVFLIKMGRAPLKFNWLSTNGLGVSEQVEVSSNLLIYLTRDGLYKVDKNTGQILEKSTEFHLDHVLINNGIIYGCSRSMTCAINPSNLKIIWKVNEPAYSITFHQGKLFCVDGDHLFALNAVDGNLYWKTMDNVSWPIRTLEVTGDRVLVRWNENKHIYGYDINNGKIIWELLGDDFCATDKTLYVIDIDEIGSLTAYDIVSESKLWEKQYNLSQIYYDSARLFGIKTIYGESRGLVYQISAIDGTLLWKNEIKDFKTKLTLTNDKVYIYEPQGNVTAYSMKDGKVLFDFNLPVSLDFLDIAFDNKNLYFGTEYGFLYSLSE